MSSCCYTETDGDGNIIESRTKFYNCIADAIADNPPRIPTTINLDTSQLPTFTWKPWNTDRLLVHINYTNAAGYTSYPIWNNEIIFIHPSHYYNRLNLDKKYLDDTDSRTKYHDFGTFEIPIKDTNEDYVVCEICKQAFQEFSKWVEKYSPIILDLFLTIIKAIIFKLLLF